MTDMTDDVMLTPQPHQNFWKYAPIEQSGLPIRPATFRQASGIPSDMVRKVAQLGEQYVAPVPNNNGTSPSPSGGGSGKGGGGGGNAPGGSSVQGTVPILQAPRVSAIVSDNSCQADQIVLSSNTDSGLQRKSASFVHVYWRSLSDIFQYLGAVLRRNKDRAYLVKVFPDRTIQDGSSDAGDGTDDESKGIPVTLFSAIENGAGDLKVRYGSGTYAVANLQKPGSDFTKPILSIVSTLVNVAAQQTVSPSSAPIRFLPLP
jgi:hypothetical protein